VNIARGRLGVRLPVNRSFERELAQLESMSGRHPDADGIERLRKALGHENNYLVSKAARLVADNTLSELLPEVLTAYARFFVNAVKSDPQCWAKIALVKALVKLECRDAAVYLRGLRHTQEEPAWGGQSDTAGPLRATCTHALVTCDSLTSLSLLHILLEPLVDQDKTVRLEAVRAIGHIGGVSAALLLRLRVLLRKEEAEIMGACFSALLAMDGANLDESIALVAGFLDDGEEAAAEAALALAEVHRSTAIAALIARRRKGADAWYGSVLDHAIALTRAPEGLDFLLGEVEQDTRQAPSALEAISRVYTSTEVRNRTALAVEKANSERVHMAFRQYFSQAAREK
jgi:hypothetical protein